MVANKTRLVVINPGFNLPRKILYEKIIDNYDVLFIFITSKNKELAGNKIKRHSKFLSLDGIRYRNLGVYGILKLFLYLIKAIKEFDPDVILTSTHHPFHSKIAYFIAKLKAIKILVWIETWKENPHSSLAMKTYHVLSKYILRHTDAILVHGTSQKEYCIQLGINNRKIFNFHILSLDLKNYKINKDIITKIPIKKNIILFVGRLMKMKGVQHLLKAFSILKKETDNNIFLLIVGDGEYAENLKSLAKELDIKDIMFWGWAPMGDLPTFYSVSDLFVLPSYNHKGFIEGWGLVINEAVSMSLPIITTDNVGASKDLVIDGINGYIVNNGNIKELRIAIKDIIEDDTLKEKMGKKSREIFEEFNDPKKAIKALRMAIQYAINNIE